ncbi:hypothetical protein [Cutibacterium sp.]|uniref:hypothetical protein n=1 Tax=Cutibacterium sp. TaxID=1912221 RepID=UPI0026DDCA6F|nr:hypothetical protein [Cutibacterium sp.]MDO4412700.1 hypothetical protein [Cutibacterium sp.]
MLVAAIVALTIFGFRSHLGRVDGSTSPAMSVRKLSDNAPTSLSIDGQPVQAGQLRYALREVKTQVVADCGDGQRSIGSDFWQSTEETCTTALRTKPRSQAERLETQVDSALSTATSALCQDAKDPAHHAACLAVHLLEKQQSTYHLAADAGQTENATWDDVLSNLRELIPPNLGDKTSGPTTYGIDTDIFPTLVERYQTQLANQYINDDDAPGMDVTDKEVRAYYKSRSWNFGPSIEGISSESEKWKVISPLVETDLRRTIYDQLRASTVKHMHTVADPNDVVDFVQATYTQG